ncbi:hypothetical protein LEQ06_16745 [Paraclostridium sp. AKS46]|nr:hypothetical protein [Paraclostridium sp. AKS46]
MLKTKITILILVALMGSTIVSNANEVNTQDLILGGCKLKQCEVKSDKRTKNYDEENIIERFFRPSKLPILMIKTKVHFIICMVVKI